MIEAKDNGKTTLNGNFITLSAQVLAILVSYSELIEKEKLPPETMLPVKILADKVFFDYFKKNPIDVTKGGEKDA